MIAVETAHSTIIIEQFEYLGYLAFTYSWSTNPCPLPHVRYMYLEYTRNVDSMAMTREGISDIRSPASQSSTSKKEQDLLRNVESHVTGYEVPRSNIFPFQISSYSQSFKPCSCPDFSFPLA